MTIDRRQLRDLGEFLNEADPAKRAALLKKTKLKRDTVALSAKVDKIEKGIDKGWW